MLHEVVAEAFATSGVLAAGAATLARAELRGRDGSLLPFAAGRWHADAAAEEVEVLADVEGPVLDLGCGPGRLVAHLLERGVEAVGVDSAPDAVDAATHRGAPALLADLWGPLPDEGRWRTVLLFDGNIGIGARPEAMLARCGELLAPGGSVVVEVGTPGTVTRCVQARIEWDGRHSSWFPWATVAATDLPRLGAGAGMELRWLQQHGGRCFARLQTAAAAGSGADADDDADAA